jgi:hypothetical protein
MDPLDISETGVVDGWLDTAIAAIEDKFGSGYASAHPELVGAYIQACAAAVGNELLKSQVVAALDGVRDGLRDIEQTLARGE